LLVSELVSNCVLHADLLPSDHIGLVVEDLGRCVRVEVADPGRAYDDAKAGWSRAVGDSEPSGQLVRNLADRAYGLLLVHSEADRCGLSWDDGTVAWFEIAVDPEG